MYNLKDIKAIPCEDIAKKYGIDLTRKHKRLWGKLREEKTASFSINLEKNLWYDFGSGKGGSVIDLVAEIEGISPIEAIHRLAEEYGFKKEQAIGFRPLTNSQYKELGIEPERATMNFRFDLNKHSIEQLKRWEKKYAMPVKELANKYPNIYNKMVKKIALDNINVLRDVYYSRLELLKDPSHNKVTKEFLKSQTIENAKEINKKIDLLDKALTYKDKGIKKLKVDFEKDLNNLKEIQKNKALSQDEKIRNRIVKVYKKLFSYDQAEYLKTQHAKALYELNKALTKTENKFLSVKDIKNAYKAIGEKIETLENEYSNALKNNDREVLNSIENKLSKIKYLFNKCSIAIEGLREANMNYKNDISKQKNIDINKDKMLNNSIEIT